MKRLGAMALVLGVAGLCFVAVLPAHGATGAQGLPNAPPSVLEEIDSLLSPELLRALNLNPGQLGSLEELRRRDWSGTRGGAVEGEVTRSAPGSGYRPGPTDGRRYGPPGSGYGYGPLNGRYPVPRYGYPWRGYGGGYGIRVHDGDDDLEAFLAILSLGLVLSQGMGQGYGYGYDDYGYGTMIQLDDFLYLFQILDLAQRDTFAVYFDGWYDNRYYRHGGFYGYGYPYYGYGYGYPYYGYGYGYDDRYDGYDGRHREVAPHPNHHGDRYDRYHDDRYDGHRDGDRYDGRRGQEGTWRLPGELESRLRLDDRQRQEMERVFRDIGGRQQDRTKRYMEMEKDYFKRSWQDPSGRQREEQRRKLFEARKELRIPEREIRERVRPILNDSQRRTFESMVRNRAPSQWKQNSGSSPMIRRPVKNDH